MSPQQTEAAIAAFLRSRGVTRCPTACVAPTHASGNATDRAALRERAERAERAEREEVLRGERVRQDMLQAFGRAA